MPDFVLYNLKVALLTPLHIGNGRALLNLYDYSIHGGKTWRINEAAVLDAQSVDDPRQAEILARTPPAQLLKPEDYRPDSPFFRYVIQGTPKATGEGAELQEQIKDPHDRPYLPGSSLKGALRTAIAWVAWQEKGLRPEVHRLGNSPKWAASGYEKMLFGPNPNKDLFRALHVSDSAPRGADSMMLLNVRVLTHGGKPGAPVEVEAIRPNVVFEMTMKLDRALYSDWAKGYDLRLQGAQWLEDLPEIVRKYSQARLEQESAWAKASPAFQKYAASYHTIQQAAPAGGNQFLLQLGWGAGWESKTFGSHLKRDATFMRTILKPVRQGGYGVARTWPPEDVTRFPTSRRIAMSYKRDAQGIVVDEIPAAPLGWVLVELTPKA